MVGQAAAGHPDDLVGPDQVTKTGGLAPPAAPFRAVEDGSDGSSQTRRTPMKSKAMTKRSRYERTPEGRSPRRFRRWRGGGTGSKAGC